MTVRVVVNNWDKYNPRKDVKRPSWFPFDNRMIEDSDFFRFSHAEFKTWIYILSRSSQRHSATIDLDPEHADRVCRIPQKEFHSALRKLEELGTITVDVTRTSRARHADVQNPYATLQDNTDSTVHNKHNSDPASSTAVSAASLESVYQAYPLKKGKTKGLAIATKEIVTADLLAAFTKAVDNYREEMVRHKTDPKFIKHFSTFMHEWRDWIDFIPTPSAKNYANERDIDHDAEIAAIMGMA